LSRRIKKKVPKSVGWGVKRGHKDGGMEQGTGMIPMGEDQTGQVVSGVRTWREKKEKATGREQYGQKKGIMPPPWSKNKQKKNCTSSK